jgi:hypothetical protein
VRSLDGKQLNPPLPTVDPENPQVPANMPVPPAFLRRPPVGPGHEISRMANVYEQLYPGILQHTNRVTFGPDRQWMETTARTGVGRSRRAERLPRTNTGGLYNRRTKDIYISPRRSQQFGPSEYMPLDSLLFGTLGHELTHGMDYQRNLDPLNTFSREGRARRVGEKAEEWWNPREALRDKMRGSAIGLINTDRSLQRSRRQLVDARARGDTDEVERLEQLISLLGSINEEDRDRVTAMQEELEQRDAATIEKRRVWEEDK